MRRRILLIVIAATVLCVAYGYFIEPQRLVINRRTIYIQDWGPAFDGLTIVVISDLHGGSNAVTPERIRRVVSEANALNPDITVLLGDYVAQSGFSGAVSQRNLKMPMDVLAVNLAGLRAKHGVFAVLGNHDGWYSDAIVRTELQRIGYKVLENEVVSIERDGRKLRILGLEDHLKVQNWQWLSNKAKRSVESDNNDGDIIVLEHSPDVLPMITGERSISPRLKLVLAGHTHGGQIWLPVLGSPIVPSSYGQKYVSGHVKENGVAMFVTTGIGTSILPFRFMVPPEIAFLTIRAN